MSRAFFEQVVEALVGFLPPERRGFSSRVSGRNAKLWFGDEAREHYEVQLVRQRGATVLEVGFHAEHSDAARNEAAIARILAAEGDWRFRLPPLVQRRVRHGWQGAPDGAPPRGVRGLGRPRWRQPRGVPSDAE